MEREGKNGDTKCVFWDSLEQNVFVTELCKRVKWAFSLPFVTEPRPTRWKREEETKSPKWQKKCASLNVAVSLPYTLFFLFLKDDQIPNKLRSTTGVFYTVYLTHRCSHMVNRRVISIFSSPYLRIWLLLRGIIIAGFFPTPRLPRSNRR